jgi:hypothetical protein
MLQIRLWNDFQTRIWNTDLQRGTLRGITTGADCGWDKPGIQLLHYHAKEMAGLPHASLMLRLYRKNSIKLMLAWETCCRLSPSLAPSSLSAIMLTVALNAGCQALDLVCSSHILK